MIVAPVAAHAAGWFRDALPIVGMRMPDAPDAAAGFYHSMRPHQPWETDYVQAVRAVVEHRPSDITIVEACLPAPAPLLPPRATVAGAAGAASTTAGADAAAAGCVEPADDPVPKDFVCCVRQHAGEMSSRVKLQSSEWGVWGVAPDNDVWGTRAVHRKPASRVKCLSCAADELSCYSGRSCAHVRAVEQHLRDGTAAHSSLRLDLVDHDRPITPLSDAAQSTVGRPGPFDPHDGDRLFVGRRADDPPGTPAVRGPTWFGSVDPQLLPATACDTCSGVCATPATCACACGCRHTCGCGSMWSAQQLVADRAIDIHTSMVIIAAVMLMYVCRCCKQILRYDGLRDGLFVMNGNRGAFMEQTIRKVLQQWGTGVHSLQSAGVWLSCNTVGRHQANAVVTAYLDAARRCQPVLCPDCGSDPTHIVADGTSIGCLTRLFPSFGLRRRPVDDSPHLGLERWKYAYLYGPGMSDIQKQLLHFTHAETVAVSTDAFDKMGADMSTWYDKALSSTHDADARQARRLLALHISIVALTSTSGVAAYCSQAARTFLRSIVCEGVTTMAHPFAHEKLTIMRALSSGVDIGSAAQEPLRYRLRTYMPLMHTLYMELRTTGAWDAAYPFLVPLFQQLAMMGDEIVSKIAQKPASMRGATGVRGGKVDKVPVSEGADLGVFTFVAEKWRQWLRFTPTFAADTARGVATPRVGVAGVPADDEDTCCAKLSPTCKDRTPGIFSVYCSHGYWYGHQLMCRGESPALPFHFILERLDPSKDRVVFYDNACHLALYAAKRYPQMLGWCHFLTDRLHLKNHHTCNPELDPKYWSHMLGIHTDNSQAAEQAHKQLQGVRSSLQSMEPQKMLQYLGLYFTCFNHHKLLLRHQRLGGVVSSAAATCSAAASDGGGGCGEGGGVGCADGGGGSTICGDACGDGTGGCGDRGGGCAGGAAGGCASCGGVALGMAAPAAGGTAGAPAAPPPPLPYLLPIETATASFVAPLSDPGAPPPPRWPYTFYAPKFHLYSLLYGARQLHAAAPLDATVGTAVIDDDDDDDDDSEADEPPPKRVCVADDDCNYRPSSSRRGRARGSSGGRGRGRSSSRASGRGRRRGRSGSGSRRGGSVRGGKRRAASDVDVIGLTAGDEFGALSSAGRDHDHVHGHRTRSSTGALRRAPSVDDGVGDSDGDDESALTASVAVDRRRVGSGRRGSNGRQAAAPFARAATALPASIRVVAEYPPFVSATRGRVSTAASDSRSGVLHINAGTVAAAAALCTSMHDATFSSWEAFTGRGWSTTSGMPAVAARVMLTGLAKRAETASASTPVGASLLPGVDDDTDMIDLTQACMAATAPSLTSVATNATVLAPSASTDAGRSTSASTEQAAANASFASASLAASIAAAATAAAARAVAKAQADADVAADPAASAAALAASAVVLVSAAAADAAASEAAAAARARSTSNFELFCEELASDATMAASVSSAAGMRPVSVGILNLANTW